MLALLLTGCGGGKEYTDSNQSYRAQYCFICGQVEAGADLVTYEENYETDKPEKTE